MNFNCHRWILPLAVIISASYELSFAVRRHCSASAHLYAYHLPFWYNTAKTVLQTKYQKYHSGSLTMEFSEVRGLNILTVSIPPTTLQSAPRHVLSHSVLLYLGLFLLRNTIPNSGKAYVQSSGCLAKRL